MTADVILSREEKQTLSAGLDAAGTRIRVLLTSITKNAFEIGQILNRVKSTEAWSVNFASFEAWVATTGVSISTAARLQKIAIAYTRDEYLALVGLGTTKLYLLSSMSAEDRKQLMPVAKHGDVEKLTAAVQRIRAGRGEVVRAKPKTPVTRAELIDEFTRWAASLPCMKGDRCAANSSANSGEYCVVHAARAVLSGERIGKKLLRRIS